MKTKLKVLCIAICIVMVSAVFIGCGKTKEKIFTFAGTALAGGQVGVAYSQSIETAEGEGSPAITYSLKENTLPSGLSLSGGSITGTPTAATTTAVSFTVIAKAEGFADAEATFSIAVEAGILAFAGAALPAAVADEAYSYTFAATGAGNPAVTYALASDSPALPSWLSITNGVLSGTPDDAADAFTFKVIASAANYKSATAEFSLKVINENEFDYTGSVLADATINVDYEASVKTAVAAKGNPVISYNITSGTLPAGLVFDNGDITGAATELAEDVKFTVTASAAGFISASTEFTISVALAPPKSYVFEVAVADLTYFDGGSMDYGGDFPGPTTLEPNGEPDSRWPTENYISPFFQQAMHQCPGETIKWSIYSYATENVTVTLKMSLAMEIVGTFYMNSSDEASGGRHLIDVNGKYVDYGNIVLSRASADVPMRFDRHVIADITLKPGINTISFTTGANDWIPDSHGGGPAIEALVIDSRTELGWATELGFPFVNNLLHNFPFHEWVDPNLSI